MSLWERNPPYRRSTRLLATGNPVSNPERRDRIGWVYAGDVVPVSMSCAVSFLVLFVMYHISAKPRGETSRVTVGAVGGVAGWVGSPAMSADDDGCSRASSR